MHLLIERRESDNALTGVDSAKAQKMNTERGTETRAAMEPITPVHTAPPGQHLASLPIEIESRGRESAQEANLRHHDAIRICRLRRGKK